jgi:peptidyl-prolyl cis-trans isomerase SurA
MSLLPLLPMALLAGAPSPTPMPVDRIAALVDESPILLSEVEDRGRAELAKLGREGVSSGEIARRRQEMLRALLATLIDERLLDNQIKLAKVDLTDEELQSTIDDIKRQNQIPDDKAFAQALEHEGLTMETYRVKLKRDLEKMKLLNLKVQAKVTDADVREAYDKAYLHASAEQEVHARHVLLSLKPGAPAADEQRVLEKAREVAQKAKAGEDFALLAKQYSDGPSAAQGGDLGYFKRGVMVSELEAAAFSLPVGGVSDPIRTRFGYHVLKIEDRRAVPPPPFDQVKEQLRAKLRQEQSEKLTAEYLGELRKESTVDIKIEELRPSPKPDAPAPPH